MCGGELFIAFLAGGAVVWLAFELLKKVKQ